MKTRLITLVLCFVLTLCSYIVVVDAAETIPANIDAPKNIGISAPSDSDGLISSYEIGYTFPDNLRKLAGTKDIWYADNSMSSLEIYSEFDYKYNKTGNWHYSTAWDGESLAPDPFNMGYLDVSGENTSMYIHSDILTPVVNKVSILKDNSLYFRVRFVVKYSDANDKSIKLVSPWSSEVVIGKDAGKNVIKVECPVLTKATLKNDDVGAPYFEITNSIPESVKTQNNSNGSISIQVEYRINGGNWKAQTGYNRLIPVFDVKPENASGANSIKIDASTYEIRARYGLGSVYAMVDTWSPYSNILKVSMPYFYKGASKWAEPELDRAVGYGFITNRIKDNLSGNITREEFAEVVVKLYEKYTGKKAGAGKASFTDTTNPEILKASNLGMVLGVGNGKYAPKQLVTREQMSTILLRALKVINPTADFSTTGAVMFADDKEIVSWAKDGVYYCSKNNIAKGGGNNLFNPRGNSSREAAVIVCTRAYELYMKK